MKQLIGDALFTKSQQKVLSLLLGKPDQRFFMNEIMRKAAMGRGTIRRELDKLEQVGILTVEREGKQLYYQANPQCPVFEELVSLVKKTFGLRDVIADALDEILDGVQLAFIYGSMAKGDEHQTSDVDLLLVGDALEYGAVMSSLLPIEAELGRPVNPTLYSVAEFTTKLREGHSFIVRITEQPKLMIKGLIDDFRQPVKDSPTSLRKTG